MNLKTGQTITVKRPERAYGYENIVLMPGETVTVVNPKAPAVTGRCPYFAYCERRVNGGLQRFGIFPDNVDSTV